MTGAEVTIEFSTHFSRSDAEDGLRPMVPELWVFVSEPLAVRPRAI